LRPRTTAIVAAALLLVVGACSSGSQAAPTSTAAATVSSSTASAAPTTTEAGGFTASGFRTRTAGVLIVGTERLVPPWFIGSPLLVSGGFDYDLAAEVARRLGVAAIKVVPSSLVLIMTAQDCKCDVMLGGVTITDDRARTLDLTEPYMPAGQGVLVRKGTAVPSVTAAASLRWGVALRNASGFDVLSGRVKPVTEPDVVVNEDEGVRRLADGRLDALMLDTPQALAIANANPALAVAGQFKTDDQYALALSLGSPNTALINDAIRDMRSDGTIDLLLRAYFGEVTDKVPEIPA
jgi:ABC-type amino acid transport substrate-binding protein